MPTYKVKLEFTHNQEIEVIAEDHNEAEDVAKDKFRDELQLYFHTIDFGKLFNAILVDDIEEVPGWELQRRARIELKNC
jgi:hypothetical protein